MKQANERRKMDWFRLILLPLAMLLAGNITCAPVAAPPDRSTGNTVAGEKPASTTPSVTRVIFRDDHTFLVDGKPFFPIGLYYAQEEIADPTGNGLAALKAMGFNYIFYNGTNPQEMERITRAGLYIHSRPPGSLASQYNLLPAFVEKVRTHVPLLLWEMEDEPTLNKVDFEKTKKGCAILRQLDPDHPILVNHDTYISREDLQRWGSICDIHGFDFYPVPLKQWWYGSLGLPVIRFSGSHSIAVMGQLTAAWQKSVPDKPVLPVLQAFSWDPVKYGKQGYPTPDEERYMAYQVVIDGAKGISFYGRPLISTPSTAVLIPPEISKDPARAKADFETGRQLNRWFWEQITPVIREVAEMAPVFAARDADWRPSIAPQDVQWGNAGAVESRVKQLDAAWVVLMVNSAPKGIRADIRLPILPKGGTVYEWTAGKRFDSRKTGAFRSTLTPFAVRVYSNRSKKDVLGNSPAILAPLSADK